MNQKAIIFGDIHSQWRAAKIILDEARKSGIDLAVNLGDDIEHFGTDDYDMTMLWETFRKFLRENPRRKLIGLFGEHNARLPVDILESYIGVDSDGRPIGSLIYKEGNVIAGHNGGEILDQHGDTIHGHSGLEPLLVLHGHSECINILPEYRWLRGPDKVRFLEQDQMHKLEPGRVYWVSPGRARWQEEYSSNHVNFAVYDPKSLEVTLRTLHIGYWP
ncbi:hypothetical protein J4206_04480 [Candidatus Woesearchaeota archaeon]|nr:hypothetical protein [Candidatus Woesearchaeota archaeon]